VSNRERAEIMTHELNEKIEEDPEQVEKFQEVKRIAAEHLRSFNGTWSDMEIIPDLGILDGLRAIDFRSIKGRRIIWPNRPNEIHFDKITSTKVSDLLFTMDVTIDLDGKYLPKITINITQKKEKGGGYREYAGFFSWWKISKTEWETRHIGIL